MHSIDVSQTSSLCQIVLNAVAVAENNLNKTLPTGSVCLFHISVDFG